jgi:hypothetical protein
MGVKRLWVAVYFQGSIVVVLIAVIVVNCGREADMRRRVESLEKSRTEYRKIKLMQDVVNDLMLSDLKESLNRLEKLKHESNTSRSASHSVQPGTQH